MSWQILKDEDALWEFLKQKELHVSKRVFVLQPKYTNFENNDEDLPEINTYFCYESYQFVRNKWGRRKNKSP